MFNDEEEDRIDAIVGFVCLLLSAAITILLIASAIGYLTTYL